MPKTLMWFILIVLSCLVMLVGILIWIPRLFLTSPSLLEVLNQQTRHHTGYEGSWMALSLDGNSLAKAMKVVASWALTHHISG